MSFLDGEVEPTENNMFVDDNIIDEVKECILQAIAVSIEVLFLVTGPDQLKMKRSNPSMDKFYWATCASVKEQLGVINDTNKMITKMNPTKINT